MSVGFLHQEHGTLRWLWRGPKKKRHNTAVLSDVCWGDPDYLVVDTPPGEHTALIG